jgi:hypothetical protein
MRSKSDAAHMAEGRCTNISRISRQGRAPMEEGIWAGFPQGFRERFPDTFAMSIEDQLKVN